MKILWIFLAIVELIFFIQCIYSLLKMLFNDNFFIVFTLEDYLKEIMFAIIFFVLMIFSILNI